MYILPQPIYHFYPRTCPATDRTHFLQHAYALFSEVPASFCSSAPPPHTPRDGAPSGRGNCARYCAGTRKTHPDAQGRPRRQPRQENDSRHSDDKQLRNPCGAGTAGTHTHETAQPHAATAGQPNSAPEREERTNIEKHSFLLRSAPPPVKAARSALVLALTRGGTMRGAEGVFLSAYILTAFTLFCGRAHAPGISYVSLAGKSSAQKTDCDKLLFISIRM